MAEAAQRSTMLELIGLKVSYGGIQAVKGVDLTVKAGELVALIGANGAGKTTTSRPSPPALLRQADRSAWTEPICREWRRTSGPPAAW